MLFFTRAFVCIGTVVLLAEGFGLSDVPRASRVTAEAIGPAVLGPVAALCRSKPETCMSIAAAAARTAVDDAPAADAGGVAGGRTARPKLQPLSRREPARASELSSRAFVPR